MAKSPRRLGRGLDSLVSNLRTTQPFPDEKPEEAPKALDRWESNETSEKAAFQTASVQIDDLDPNPFQPRGSMERADILSLARSIEQSGVLQPLIARAVGDRYQIVAGERRWRAARAAGMTHVPVVVREANDDQMVELALIENIQREDLNAIDRARAYRQLAERCDLKPEEVGARTGEDRTTVANYLRLLELPSTIQTLVIEGALSAGHARCLLGLDSDTERLNLAESSARNDLSVRALEEIVRRRKTRQSEPDGQVVVNRGEARSAHIRDLERRFEEAVKTKVVIHEGKRKGTGRIVVEYFSFDDFDRIARLLGVALDDKI